MFWNSIQTDTPLSKAIDVSQTLYRENIFWKIKYIFRKNTFINHFSVQKNNLSFSTLGM